MGDDNALVKQVNNKPKRDGRGRLLPGNSGNLAGRPPKGHSITDTIRAMMDAKPEIKQALGTKVLQLALDGDLTAIKLLWSYLEGMPKIRNEIMGPEGGELVIKVIEESSINIDEIKKNK